MFHCSFQAELLPLMSFLSGNSCCSMKVNERKPDSVSIYSLATSFLPLVFFPFPPTYLFFLLEMKLSCAHYLRSRYQKQIHPSKEFYDGLRQSHWWLSPESCQILHVRKHLQISWTQTGFPETTRFSHGLVKAILPLNKQNFPTAGPGSPGCGHSNLQLKLSFRISPQQERVAAHSQSTNMMLPGSIASTVHFTHTEGIGEDLQMLSPYAKEAGSQKNQKENTFLFAC